MSKYKVTKNWGDFLAGDIVDDTQLDESVLIADLVSDGTFEAIPDATDIPSDPSQPTTSDPATSTTPSTVQSDPAAASSDIPPTSSGDAPVSSDLTSTDPIPTPENASPAPANPPAVPSVDPDEDVSLNIPKNDPKLMFNGLEVVTDGVREVNGQLVRHLKLSDGTECDVTDEEYKTMQDALNS